MVIALPDTKWPNKALTNAGLRPEDPPLGPDDANSRALIVLGGAATRVGKDGRFSLGVPSPGHYRVLVISNNAKRPTGDPIPSYHVQELNKYFDSVLGLLGHSLYKWPREPRQVLVGTNVVNVDFNPE